MGVSPIKSTLTMSLGGERIEVFFTGPGPKCRFTKINMRDTRPSNKIGASNKGSGTTMNSLGGVGTASLKGGKRFGICSRV